MDQDMETGGDQPLDAPQAHTHEDIPHLRHGGIRQHPLDMVLPHSSQRAQNHSQQPKGQDHAGDSQLHHQLHGENPQDHHQQQHDVPLQHQAGQDGGGRCGGAAVGIRQPQVEGEHGALDAQSRHQQPYSHRQRERVALREPQLRHCLRQRGHQQIAGDAVQNGQPDQEQPGPHQAHEQVPDGGDQIGAVVLGHHQRAGRDGAGLDEHIPGEHVVGVGQCQQGRLQHVHHDKVKLLLLRQDVLKQVPPPARQSKGHHQGEHGGQQCLKRPAVDGVAVRRQKSPHGVGEAHSLCIGVFQYPAVQQRGCSAHSDGDPVADPPAADGRGHDGRQDSQKNRKEGKVLHKRPHQSSSFLARSSSSRISMVP